jgi:Zn2+/Cd2+-exporting ATPase
MILSRLEKTGWWTQFDLPVMNPALRHFKERIMINRLITLLRSPRQRTQFELIASGLLILSALSARYLLNSLSWHNGLMAAAAVIGGADIAVRAFNALRNRHISIELLVTIATVGALIIGEVWEAAAVTFLFMMGAHLEARTLSRTRKVIGELLDLAPVTALVLRDGQQLEVAPHEVLTGETVLLKPGAKVPVDGEVIAGASAVDESMITGEPVPEEKTRGEQVYAGSVNLGGLLQVKATGTGADTTLARIIARVEEAQEEKAPTQRFIEKFAAWYTPGIIILSIVVYLFSRQIELALTLLVIACPGALVISTPVSVIAGIGQSARRGILIKGGEHLENAGRITALALDKTGTLTYGKPYLSDILVLEHEAALPAGEALQCSDHNCRWSLPQQEILYWAGIAENGSEHPLARAILQEAKNLGDVPMPDHFDAYPGKGICASYLQHDIQVGTTAWFTDQGMTLPQGLESHMLELRDQGKTATAVAIDGVLRGILGISDRVRESAAPALKQLRSSGIHKIVMLTGDDERTAQAVAKDVGLDDVRASLLPEDKLQAIQSLQREGYVVAMIGDGINDAPALAAADVGIAMGAAGSGVAIETADIALMADDLFKVPEAIRLSKATLKNIRQNLAVALITVTLLLAGVLLGRVHMAGGMFVHQISVLIVIANGMRLLRK